MYRVVIIDDEMIIRVGFKSLIDWNAEGFVVAGEASNGLEGLELCRKVKPHVVFTDIVMAKLDGIGFIEQLLKDMPRDESDRAQLSGGIWNAAKKRCAWACGTTFSSCPLARPS